MEVLHHALHIRIPLGWINDDKDEFIKRMDDKWFDVFESKGLGGFHHSFDVLFGAWMQRRTVRLSEYEGKWCIHVFNQGFPRITELVIVTQGDVDHSDPITPLLLATPEMNLKFDGAHIELFANRSWGGLGQSARLTNVSQSLQTT